MKLHKLTLTLAILFASIVAFAQVPQGIQYQTVARDNNGSLLTNTNISLQITIRQGSANGTDVYQETHAATTNDFGLASMVIGEGTPVSGTFPAIDWTNAPYFVNVALDPAGGSTFTDMGTSELMSVPYALYAASSGGAVWSADQNGITYNGGNVGIGRASLLNVGLGVNGNMVVDTLIEIDNSGQAYGIRVNADGQLQFMRNGSTTQDIITLDDDTEAVGIGTTTPSATLDVDGDYNSSGAITIAGNIDMGDTINVGGLRVSNVGSSNLALAGDIVPYGGSGLAFDLGNNTATEHWDDVVGNSFVTFSDAQLKHDIAKIGVGLNEIMALRPVQYVYNENIDFDGKTRYGLLAQEVEAVIPNVVINEDVDRNIETGEIERKPTEYKALNYVDLVPVLIQAVQEQQEQIEELKTEIEALKNK